MSDDLWRDWNRANREIAAIRAAPVDEAAGIGPFIGEADQHAEKAMIKQELVKENMSAFSDYIHADFERTDKLPVVLINRDTGTVKQDFRTAEAIVRPEYQAYLRAANAHRNDVYVGVNPLKPEAHGRTKDDVARVAHLYLDIDSGGRKAVDAILQAEGMPKPHHVLETSPGRSQMLWRVYGFNHETAEATVRGMAQKHAADQSVWDVSRILRVPGFANHKRPEKHWVRAVETPRAEKRAYSVADFPRFEIAHDRIVVPRQPGQERTIGGRDVSQSAKDWGYVLHRMERGESPDKIRQDVLRYRQEHAPKPNLEQYVDRTIRKAMSQSRGLSR